MKKNILLLCLTITANANLQSFYQKSVKHLNYQETYRLQKEANQASEQSITSNRYANFSIDASQTLTKAQTVSNPFNITDIGVSDTLDLFNKSRYQIELIRLDTQSKETLLRIQKEKLFISIVEMIGLYHQTQEKLELHNSLLNEQELIYNKLQSLQQSGAISKLIVVEFKNALTGLESKIIKEQNSIEQMQKQLQLYAPNESIPSIENSTLTATKEEFVAHNPQATLNNIASQQVMLQSQALKDKYLPDITAGVNYQYNDDPTAYGNSYGVNISFHIPIGLGDQKEKEAIKVHAMSLKSQNETYKIEREQEFISRYQNYKNATQQLNMLTQNLEEYQNSFDMVKKAFLKKYIDFNTYIQSLSQLITIEEQIIDVRYQKNTEAIIVNSISLL
ncbi:MAG TPA: TolC family protein [Campylobacterales bacterium]|nr:TolC family protein [Campylobacterales bacterium]HHH51282.1 TolC family protein [Campylobacterales bacterium]